MTQIISFIFWLAAVPFCIGQIPAYFMPGERSAQGLKRNMVVIFLAGYLLMWAVFELIAVPAVVLIQYDNFLFVLRGLWRRQFCSPSWGFCSGICGKSKEGKKYDRSCLRIW